MPFAGLRSFGAVLLVRRISARASLGCGSYHYFRRHAPWSDSVRRYRLRASLAGAPSLALKRARQRCVCFGVAHEVFVGGPSATI